ncbi:MAG: ATP/GTP-binding protein [Bacteroidetes bacterium]|nr:ATP/GTP-binding protein [Bacteroidota bacterium]
MSQQKKTTTNPSEKTIKIQSKHNYENALLWLEKWGKKQYGEKFRIQPEDKETHLKLLCYFLKDEAVAKQLNINLEKGILLCGPIGAGKTSIMNLMRLFEPAQDRFIMKSCRDVSFEFIKEGFDIIHRYTHKSFHPQRHTPKNYCFDDLGTENSLKYYGNETNVLMEILLSRYDLFVSRKLITHLTTNLSAPEIEEIYGNRLRSRMREMFNLISFNINVPDKRI